MRPRGRFNQAAERYDRARPGYPPPLSDELARWLLSAGLPGAGDRLPDRAGHRAVGRAGCRIVAVELGAAMAAVAWRNLAASPRSRWAVAAFED